MKFRNFVLLSMAMLLLLIFTGCAQPNDPEDNDGDEVYLLLEAVYPSEGYVVDIKVTDDYVYVAEDEAGFSIWDNTTNTMLTRYRENIFGNIKRIAVDEASNGMLVYNKSGSETGVKIYDIRDKSNPVFRFNHSGNTADISVFNATPIDSTKFQFYWLNDDNLYYTGEVRSSLGGDIWMLQGLADGNFDYDVADFDEYYDTGKIYCASFQLGLKIVEKQISDYIVNFPLAGTVGTIGQTIAVKVVDNIAYLGNREEGIQVMDITDINNPIELFNYDTIGLASDIEVNTELNVFALASSSGGVYLFNGPEGDIRRLQRIDDSEIGYTNLIEMHSDLLYVGTRYGVYKYKIVNI